MPIAIDGKRYENDFEYTLDPIAPDEKYDDQPTRQTRVRQDEATPITEPDNPAYNPLRITVTPKRPEPLEEGNIDLNNRPIVKNPDGSISTVRSMSFNEDGKEVLIPTVVGDKVVSDQEAIDHYRNTGEHLGKFDTPENATAYAQQLHQDQDALYSKPMDEPFKNEQEKRGVIDKLLGLTGDRYQLWPEKAVKGMLHAFALPGDVAQGKEDPLSGHGIGRAFELASALIAGPAPVANKIVDGTLGSIAGISAKTADKELLNSAKAWERMGYPADQIFEHSGWFRGFDRQWKHELPSENAALAVTPDKLVHGEQYSLKDFLHFPELFEAYPALKNLSVKVNDKMSDLGRFFPNKDLIEIKSSGQNYGQMTDTMLHEIQHWIQTKENFDYGTSPQAAVKNLVTALKEKLAYAKSPDDVARIKSLIDQNNKNQVRIGEELYIGNPGEREARMVEIRRGLTAEEKQGIAPTTYQSYLDKKVPESYEVRMPWEKPPMAVDKMSSAEITQLRRAANDNKAITSLSDEALETQLRAAHLEYSKGLSLADKAKVEGTRLPRDFVDIRRTNNERYHDLYMERQRRQHARDDEAMDQINREWAELIRQQKEDAKKDLKKSLSVITNPDK